MCFVLWQVNCNVVVKCCYVCVLHSRFNFHFAYILPSLLFFRCVNLIDSFRKIELYIYISYKTNETNYSRLYFSGNIFRTSPKIKRHCCHILSSNHHKRLLASKHISRKRFSRKRLPAKMFWIFLFLLPSDRFVRAIQMLSTFWISIKK